MKTTICQSPTKHAPGCIGTNCTLPGAQEPATFGNGPLKPLTGLHIVAKRWFQRTFGNTYHSVRIYANGTELAYLPYAYGYDEQWLQTALDWLATEGYIPLAICATCSNEPASIRHSPCHSCNGTGHGRQSANYGTLYLREVLHGTYTCTDVERKRDL